MRILVEYSELEMTEELTVGEYVIFELVDIEFKHPSFQKLVKYYIDAYQNETPFSELKNVQNIEEQDVKDLMVELLSSPYELSSNWFDRHEIVVKDANRTYKTDVVSVMTRFRYYKMMEAIKILDDKIKTTEQNGQFEEMMAALLKKMELMEARKKLAKEISTVIHPF